MKRIVTLLLALFLFVTAMALGAQNDQLVNVNYLIAQSELRLSTLMALCFFCGVIVMAMISVVWSMQSRWKQVRRQRQSAAANKEV